MIGEWKKKKCPTIDIGLAVLCIVKNRENPNQTFDRPSIADVCECSQQRIAQIEAEAMKKLRFRLEPFKKAMEL